MGDDGNLMTAKPVETSTQPSSLSFNVEEDSEGEVEHVYHETMTFMASKSSRSGYGTKSWYERQKKTKDDDSYDSYDDECNAHDLTKDQLAFSGAWDIKIHGRNKS